jgi:hypothetical protein
MIVFGTAVTDRTVFEEIALPGIERAAEPGSPILTRAGLPIRIAYNQLMDEAAAQPGLEALVLLHQDLELTDGSLPGRVRRLLGDRCVGLAGALGVRNVTLHLWEGDRQFFGTVAAPGIERRFSTGSQEVEGVDGALMMLAPWVVRGVRFGRATADQFHGYDAELALRVRAYGGRVICDDIPYFHHRPPKDDFDAQRRSRVALARAWDPALRPREWTPSFQL